jgi:outer membrane receptor for ferrienterochelin and colicin
MVSGSVRSAISAPVLIIAFLSIAFASPLEAASDGDTGTIRGVVLETRGGAPVDKVLVRLQDTGRAVTTDDAGRFELDQVPPGSHELYVSAVDFILVKHTLSVSAGETTDVTIALTDGTGSLTQAVTVVGKVEQPLSKAAASAQVLETKDLQQLRGLITNDPLRAIQVLPGVATGDDFKSEFTVRGSPIDHMQFSFEGIDTPLLVHTVQRVVDTGSIAMINGDVLDQVALAGGAYPLRYGDRLGAELDFHMREGSRQRPQARVSVSGTDAALIAEGPIGGGGRGSWLTSIRKSYFDLVTSRLDTPVDFTFGFADAQSKVVYDVNAANQVQLAITAGRSRLSLDPNDIQQDDPQDARNRSALGVLSWRTTFSPRFLLTQRAAVGLNDYRNVNLSGVELARGAGHDLIYRADWTLADRPHLTFEGGGELRASALHRHDMAVAASGARDDLREQFNTQAFAESAFVQTRLGGDRWSVTPGVRLDHWTLTPDTSASPWAQANYRLTPSLTLRGGTSLAHQRPTVDELVGLRGTPDLATERAYHAEMGLEGAVSAKWIWRATGYTREERNIIRLLNTEYQVVGQSLIAPSFTTHFQNALSGHSRGAEFTLERRSSSGLSGWASYAYGHSQYHDQLTDETFWADFDQRHTVNAYGLYRFNERFSASGRFREGSNYPTRGYWEERGGAFFVGTTRNDLRIPTYARLDLRLNRTFVRRETRVTLFGEVLNVLDRNNVRPGTPGINSSTFEATHLFDQLFPRVPSAGILVEF